MLEDVVVKQVETEALNIVFKRLCGCEEEENQSPNEPKKDWKKEKFGQEEVALLLKEYKCPQSKQEIQLMIWEVDDDLDG